MTVPQFAKSSTGPVSGEVGLVGPSQNAERAATSPFGEVGNCKGHHDFSPHSPLSLRYMDHGEMSAGGAEFSLRHPWRSETGMPRWGGGSAADDGTVPPCRRGTDGTGNQLGGSNPGGGESSSVWLQFREADRRTDPAFRSCSRRDEGGPETQCCGAAGSRGHPRSPGETVSRLSLGIQQTRP